MYVHTCVVSILSVVVLISKGIQWDWHILKSCVEAAVLASHKMEEED